LPTGLKEIWIRTEDNRLNHKLPFGCVIKYFLCLFILTNTIKIEKVI
jgi:hypothetical protein